jgi:hypothetical protein
MLSLTVCWVTVSPRFGRNSEGVSLDERFHSWNRWVNGSQSDAGAVVGWCLLLLSLMQYDCLHTVHHCCFMFLANGCCHDGAGLTVVSQSDHGRRTWLLGCKLELWKNWSWCFYCLSVSVNLHALLNLCHSALHWDRLRTSRRFWLSSTSVPCQCQWPVAMAFWLYAGMWPSHLDQMVAPPHLFELSGANYIFKCYRK